MTDTLELRDDQDRTLLCEVLRRIVLNESHYALLTPMDPHVEILVWSEELAVDADDFRKGLLEEDFEGVLDEPTSEALEAVLPTARAVLAEQNLQMKPSAFDLLLVQGELPDPVDDEVLEIAKDDEVEDYQLLATFFHEDRQYGIFTPLDPLLFFAACPEGEDPALLTPEHPPDLFEQLHQLIEGSEASNTNHNGADRN